MNYCGKGITKHKVLLVIAVHNTELVNGFGF